MIDPNYLSAWAQALAHIAQHVTGYSVKVVPYLRDGGMELHHRVREIHIQRNLGFDNYRWLLDQAINRLTKGKDWAEHESPCKFLEYSDRPHLRLVHSGPGLDEDGLPYTAPLPILGTDLGERAFCGPFPGDDDEPTLALVRRPS